jgi:hypothetical protein
MESRYCVALVGAVLATVACFKEGAERTDTTPAPASTPVVQETDVSATKAPLFSCDYLGQELPGTVPQKFAPGIISTGKDESCFEIAASGDEMVFTRDGEIVLVSKDGAAAWSAPAPLSVSGGETSFAKDGQGIYFNSRTSFPGAKVALNTFVMRRSSDQWDRPVHLGEPVTDQIVHAPSVAANGNIYASGLIRLRYIDGSYQPPEKLVPDINGSHPFIAADESYMIFDRRPSSRGNPADLFISFRGPDDSWSEAVSFGEEINTTAMETNAFVTLDGAYMFFTRGFDIYWVKADCIEEIRRRSGEVSPEVER